MAIASSCGFGFGILASFDRNVAGILRITSLASLPSFAATASDVVVLKVSCKLLSFFGAVSDMMDRADNEGSCILV